MSHYNKNWDIFLTGFTVLAIISGIYLVFQKDYLSGIGGVSTGLFLLYMGHTQRKKARMLEDDQAQN